MMAALEPYRFEPELVNNPNDSDSDNDEANDCSCERCEVLPTQRECVCR